jgi:hypothetical protein
MFVHGHFKRVLVENLCRSFIRHSDTDDELQLRFVKLNGVQVCCSVSPSFSEHLPKSVGR